MSKQGEIDYLKNIGEAGAEHAMNKPFSDADCGVYLVQIGAVMSLLPPPPAKLLDLGCGTGWTSRFLARRGYDVTGVDISADMIACAERKGREENVDNLRFLVQDFEYLGFADEFDCALFFSALHHTEDEEAALRGVAPRPEARRPLPRLRAGRGPYRRTRFTRCRGEIRGDREGHAAVPGCGGGKEGRVQDL